MPRKKTKFPCDVKGCGYVSMTPQGLGSHRFRKHGIAGTSAQATAKRNGAAARSRTVAARNGSAPAKRRRRVIAAATPAAPVKFDRNALLHALYPDGAVPIDSLDATHAWLDQAERLHAANGGKSASPRKRARRKTPARARATAR